MIRRAATWTSTEETQQKNARNSRDLGGRYDIPCSLNMDASIGLRANFAIDAGAMGNGTTSADGLRERSRIREIGRDDRGRRRMTPVTAPGKEDGLMAEGNQVLREVAPDETSATGDGDFHFFLRFLSRICVGQTALRKPFKALARLSGSAS